MSKNKGKRKRAQSDSSDSSGSIETVRQEILDRIVAQAAQHREEMLDVLAWLREYQAKCHEQSMEEMKRFREMQRAHWQAIFDKIMEGLEKVVKKLEEREVRRQEQQQLCWNHDAGNIGQDEGRGCPAPEAAE